MLTYWKVSVNMLYFFIIILFAILAGLLLLWLGQRTRQQTGLPVGEVIYSDTGAWQKVEEPLIGPALWIGGQTRLSGPSDGTAAAYPHSSGGQEP